MKLIHIKIVLLLFLISFTAPSISSKVKLQRRHTSHKSQIKTNLKTKLGIGEIFSKLNETFRQPINYFLFTIGVLSAFIPEVGTVYNDLKAIGTAFVDCFSNFTPQPNHNIDSISFADYESTMGSLEQKKKTCLAEQKKFKAFKAGLEKIKNLPASASNPKKEGRLEKMEAILMSKSKSAQYMVWWSKQNCDDFNPPTTGFTDFAKTAYGLYNAVKEAGVCIGTKLAPMAQSKAVTFLKEYFMGTDFMQALISEAWGLIGNIFTLGLWGGVKATYNAILLGQDIYQFLKDPETETAFRIGAIIGKSFLVVKSLFFGRKKRKLMKRKF